MHVPAVQSKQGAEVVVHTLLKGTAFFQCTHYNRRDISFILRPISRVFTHTILNFDRVYDESRAEGGVILAASLQRRRTG